MRRKGPKPVPMMLMSSNIPLPGTVAQNCDECGTLVYVQAQNVPIVAASGGRYICTDCFSLIPREEIVPGGLLHFGTRYEKPTFADLSKIIKEVIRRGVQ